ncbi:DEAD/DEAH box helicase [Vibrio palustris]|uniref:ATP-dependent RNA helicase RhlE n=1 Tax=Vibrio palustris TaxID=1918946 RepID=A0A1R4B6V7_9VIBR|nr:DEAD/DEAH box helicase [Vibrio palustris]SJL84649.1 ATP-dependent RNA helicase RhlE [Vibrio palustris]
MSTSPSSFASLGLDPALINILQSLSIVEPTPIQAQGIPAILAGQDVLAAAQTGTGKTAAYGLPLIQRLCEPLDLATKTYLEQTRGVRALIVVPTRELAQQVLDNLQAYAQNTDLNIVAVYGGTSLSVQKNKLQHGADVLIATPGRLLDHLHTKAVSVKAATTLVLDEADRLLDMGFMPDIQRLLRQMPARQQTLFFSATFTQNIKATAYRLLDNPTEIQVTPKNSAAETVTQIVYPVDKKRKQALLSFLIGSRNWQQVLVFVKTKQGSDHLAKELKLDGIKAVSINGDKSQGARLRALEEFKSGKVRALIATDVAARGLDIAQLEQVVNYDMPFKAEDYIHRIGRTGRAGSAGLAVSLLSRDEEPALEAIERLLDTRLPQEWLAGFEPSPRGAQQDNEPTSRRNSRSAEKRKLKAKLNIHAGRGKR